MAYPSSLLAAAGHTLTVDDKNVHMSVVATPLDARLCNRTRVTVTRSIRNVEPAKLLKKSLHLATTNNTPRGANNNLSFDSIAANCCVLVSTQLSVIIWQYLVLNYFDS